MISGETDPADDGHVEIAANLDVRFYDLRHDDQAASMLAYETVGPRRVLTHPTIREEHRGRGWSKLLIRFFLDDLAAKRATITTSGRPLHRGEPWIRAADRPRPPGNWSRCGR
ncbi:hypothetical protein GCM10022206_93850 [Streptomyces chiangmaiensis]